jgi:hypothetical protein
MNPVICYLTRNDERTIKQLCCSLKLLYKHFNNKFNIPVVVFHEKDFPCNPRELIRNKFPVTFKEIELKSQIDPIPPFDVELGYTLGYRHMCQFFSFRIL